MKEVTGTNAQNVKAFTGLLSMDKLVVLSEELFMTLTNEQRQEAFLTARSFDKDTALLGVLRSNDQWVDFLPVNPELFESEWTGATAACWMLQKLPRW